MPPVERVPPLNHRDCVYWGVIERSRAWVRFDGPARAQIVARGNRLDATLLRRIAKAYNVNRGVRRHAGGEDLHAGALAAEMNDRFGEAAIPDDLEGRTALCIDFAHWARDNHHTWRTQVSAATKLLWFLRPDGWTPFDRLASEALGIWEGPAEDRARAFYQALDTRGFDSVAGGIGGILAANGLAVLGGERVVDTYLTLSAAEPRRSARVVRGCRDFLDTQPAATARRYRAVAAEIAADYGGPLLQLRDAA